MSLIKSAPRAVGLCAALILAVACNSLDVVNPNAPWVASTETTPRAVSSPRNVRNNWISVVRIER